MSIGVKQDKIHTFLFEGDRPSIRDMKDWVEKMAELRIPDSAKVVGTEMRGSRVVFTVEEAIEDNADLPAE